MQAKWKYALSAAVAMLCASGVLWFWLGRTRNEQSLDADLDKIVTTYRRIIVIMDGAGALDATTSARCRATGRRIFWDKEQALESVSGTLARLPRLIPHAIRYISSDHFRDADRLAFLELIDELAAGTSAPSTEIRTALANLHSIQNAYREEVSRIFSQFATRGAEGKREKWDAYVAWLRTMMSRDRILTEFGDGLTDEMESGMRGLSNPNEIWGSEFEPHTVALTFDDGPHPRHTEEITALLRKYGLRACFFEVGRSLGTVDGENVKLLKTAEISQRLAKAGHTVANHSYSHPVLTKLSEAERSKEIDSTSLLVEKASGVKPLLFRAPYGARNRAIIDQVTSGGMKSVMWTIDSEDWADPIPESIAMRVLHQISQRQKGIILLHDIHKQSVLALPLVLDELVQQNYNFLAFDGAGFVPSTPPTGEDRTITPAITSTITSKRVAPPPIHTTAGEKFNPYRKSWAVIIGINDYHKWPRLSYAVNDANALEQMLVNRFGFLPENVRKLLNGDATRQRIMQVLGDELSDPARVSRDDRVFFFFAGHGATRTVGENRQIGFVIPADADPANDFSTAISMTTLREACDLIPAKHIYFVMDSCYSGLALTRGAGAYSRDRSYLDEVTRRVARQILTAGGADQLAADDGPDGHSVFTWALLQGLEGKADLDGNSVITASELGAYVSPIVASFSRQTPAMGNLIGSEGGEFLFELQPEALTSMTRQLDGKALVLNKQLADLERNIADKQAELLRLQQSVKAEVEKVAARGTELAKTAPAATRHSSAYDFDRIGRQLYREKKCDEALHAFEQAVALRPNDPVLLNNLGFLYYETGKYNDAAKWLEKTLAVDPNRKEAQGNIAYTYMKLGRGAEAKAHFERYLQLFPTSPKATEVRQILTTL